MYELQKIEIEVEKIHALHFSLTDRQTDGQNTYRIDAYTLEECAEKKFVVCFS